MSYKVLEFEPKKCIGCRLCEQMCSMTHFHVTNPKKSRIRIIRDDEKQLDSAIYCHGCVDAKCIEACEFDALSRDATTNAILVSEEACVACGRCIEDCPYDHPVMHPTEDYILICDLCGGDPACVAICPENAIQLIEEGR
ncbi:MAG: 4Fe-4S dicluster domain-containing protein [Promethearchaeota archaeon]|jgi:Fe-S-cluster-containing hydrogenase component 2